MIGEALKAPDDGVTLPVTSKRIEIFSFTAVNQPAQKKRLFDANPHCG
jgi:hypothetical protein